MLIHLTPSYFLQYCNVSVALIDVSVPELGLVLENGKDVTVRFPAPNKRLHYVCRKKGRKAVYGILIETDRPVSDITLITRWAVRGAVCLHRVHMHITGTDDAVTDVIHLWHAHARTPFGDRSPSCAKGWIPAACQPRLSVAAADRVSQRETTIWRRADPAGLIREQTEFYPVPTVEPDRLTTEGWWNRRLPVPDDAFTATVRDCPDTLRVLYPGPGVTVCPLSEHLQLMQDDLKREGQEEAFNRLIAPVMQGISDRCPVFFTNTSNLMNTIRSFSPHFGALSEADKAFVESQINQPLFQISDVVHQPETGVSPCAN